MLQNFYFTAVRNLVKHKRYAVLNIFGLAIGIASFCFVALYVANELSYDRFHADYEHVYRVQNEAIIRGEANVQATTSAPMGRALSEGYPEVKAVTRLLKSYPVLVGIGDRTFSEEGMVYGEPSLLDIFNFQLIKGNKATALQAPHSMVLTEATAKKYFGNEDPMGRMLTVESDTMVYVVKGILRDLPTNTHIQLDMIASLSSHEAYDSNHWIAGGHYCHTYVKLDEGADIVGVKERMQELFYTGMAPEIEYFTELSISEWEASGNSVYFNLKPITDIHLNSDASGEMTPPGSISYLYVYGLIGLIMVVIAIFNFVNLATAHSATRAREVGVRKVIGSSRQALTAQFIVESIVVSFLATVIGALLVALLTPQFQHLIRQELAFSLFSHWRIPLLLLGFALFVGILAGIYPAVVIARFRPVDVLKGGFTARSGSGWLRNLLVTLQFTAAIAIIVVSIVVYFQTRHMLSKNLGFDKNQVLVIERSEWLGQHLDAFKNDLMSHPAIEAVSKSETVPGRNYEIRSYRRKDESETFLFLNNQVTYDYQDLMGIEVVEGRFFSKAFGADSNAVVINEAAAAAFGFDDPIGQKLTSAFKKGRTLTVIGVVKNYHYESLHKSVAPSSLELAEDWMNGYVNLRLAHTNDLAETLGFIEDRWRLHANSKPLQYFFLDQQYEDLYQSEKTTGTILVLFSGLSVFIACLGLIGLVAYSIAIRQKEIGIRKVLGASVRSLLVLLSGNIAKLVVLAALVAWPIAYFATDYWLQNFAERVSISPMIYVVATIALISIVSLFLALQTLRAANSNPVESLRDE